MIPRFASQPIAHLSRLLLASIALAGASHFSFAAGPRSEREPQTPAFRRIQLSDTFFAEGAAFGDIDGDGIADAVAGPYWYSGPGYTERHELYPPVAFDPLKYSDNFAAFVHDFNADDRADVLVIGFPGADAWWLENPGPDGGAWRRHHAFAPVDNESATFGDLLGNGRPVLVCASGKRLGYAIPDPRDPTAPWTFHAVTPAGPWTRFSHGLGFGDVNGDGRADLLEENGWWEQPASLKGDPVWKSHRHHFGAGAQMHTADIDGDGFADVITSINAHGYGLAWYQQARSADGAIDFRRHEILASEPDLESGELRISQLHAVAVADLDGDKLPDIITGKRWWAHGPDKDPEPGAPPVIQAFLLRRGVGGAVDFEPLQIDDASGVGTQLVVADADGDGRPDIVSANKRGAFVFLSSP